MVAPHIQKIVNEGWELLPDITSTPLWAAIDMDCRSSKKADRQVAYLYSAIAARENYFQVNTPTAFGNPDYSFLSGKVAGILCALEFEEKEEDGKIAICGKNGRIILSVDKLQRPDSYFIARQENANLRREFGF